MQIDDAYLGGERNGGQPGRGSENQRPFVIAVATNDQGHPVHTVIEPVPGFTKTALTAWAERRLEPAAEIYSDGLGCFAALTELGHPHTVLSNVKRALDGTYHAFRFFKYAHRYLAEAACRFNRRFRLDTLVPRPLQAVATCPPWSEHKLRAVPVYAR